MKSAKKKHSLENAQNLLRVKCRSSAPVKIAGKGLHRSKWLKPLELIKVPAILSD